jgi:hypothetical protein
MKAVLALLATSLCASGANYYVVIAGLGGTPEYEAQFVKWSADLDHNLRANGPDSHVATLNGAAVSKQKINELFGRLLSEINTDDAFALLLIGHGTFDGTVYKFNIPGPDLTTKDLASILDRVPAGRQLVVNMTSCSGASFEALKRKGRIVVTATKSGTEKNATIFPRYFADALRDPAADTDKNGTVSVLEAVRYTQHRLTSYFESEKLIATEHSLATEDGAAYFPLLRPPVETARVTNPALLKRKQELEAKIDRLKFQKAAMEESEYKEQLSVLLLELARTQAEIDR